MTQKPAIKRKIAITRTRLLPLVLMLIVTPAQAGIPPFPINPPPISDGGGWGGEIPKKTQTNPPPHLRWGGLGGGNPQTQQQSPRTAAAPPVIPAKAGIQNHPGVFLDSRFRGNDNKIAAATITVAPQPAQSDAKQPAPKTPPDEKQLARDDKNIAAARRYFLRDHPRSFARAAAAISEGSVYQPLLQYWRAVFQLRKNRPQPLAEIVAEGESPYLQNAGRRQLLEYYAGKSRWRPFSALAESPRAPLCAKLLAQIFQNQKPQNNSENNTTNNPENQNASKVKNKVKNQLRAQWRNDETIGDPLCAALYRRARALGYIGEKMIWRKLRDLAAARHLTASRRLMRVFPRRHRYSALRRTVNRASRHLRAKHSLATRANRELLMISAAVVSRRRPSLAVSRWNQFAKYFSPAENAFVYAQLGEWAARWRRSDALDLYRRADGYAKAAADKPDFYDENARAWRVRAALLADDYADALATINKMPESESRLSAWRYWRAAAMQKLGKGGEKEMQQLANDEDDYYGLLARQETGTPLMQKTTANNSQSENKNENNIPPAANGDFALALALQKAGVNNLARRIWRGAVRDSSATAEIQIAAAKKAAAQDWFLASIDAAERANASRALRFPTPYSETILKYAGRFSLDPAFVYGLIRQESRFMPKIKSSAGALGLMQVIPPTARAVARKHGYSRYRKNRLTRVDTNVILGTTYISDISKILKNSAPLIAAGYNAGPHRPRRWRKGAMAAAQWKVFVENIPITETRLYVKYVLANRAHYDAVFGAPEKQDWITRPVRIR